MVSIRNQPVGPLWKEICVEFSCYSRAIFSSAKARLANRPRPLSSAEAQRGFAGGENPLSVKSFRRIDYYKERLEPLRRGDGQLNGTEIVGLLLATKQRRVSHIVPSSGFTSRYEIRRSLEFL